jgi:hypothetical protein
MGTMLKKERGGIYDDVSFDDVAREERTVKFSQM